MAGRVMLAVVLAIAPTLEATATPPMQVSGVHLSEVYGSPVDANAGPPAQDKKPPQVVFDIPPIAERIQIDGSKNPEMIPQWDAWQAAFQIMEKVGDLPTDLLKQVSREEAASILDAARENAQNMRACEQRALKLVPTLKTEEARLINERTQALNLDCRWQTLRLRDRVLADLSPVGQAALARYVEFTKAGIRVYVPKNELSFYRQPQ